MMVAVAAIHRRQTMKPAAGYFSFQMKCWRQTQLLRRWPGIPGGVDAVQASITRPGYAACGNGDGGLKLSCQAHRAGLECRGWTEHDGYSVYKIGHWYRIFSFDLSSHGTDAQWKHDWPRYASILRDR